MLRNYRIMSGDTHTSCGILIYDEEKEIYHVRIYRDHDINDMPAILALSAQQGDYDLDEKRSLMFVKARVVPPDRQNIGQILREIGAKYYSEFAILDYTSGRCCRDNFYIEEIN